MLQKMKVMKKESLSKYYNRLQKICSSNWRKKNTVNSNCFEWHYFMNKYLFFVHYFQNKCDEILIYCHFSIKSGACYCISERRF